MLEPADQLRKPGSCGRSAPDVEIRLLDESGRDVPPGEAGEICVRSPMLMHGYYRNDAATRQALHDGFMSVGDVARVDADGYYYIVDRRIDMVVSGGVNIYPAEVEAALLTHPAIADAAVIGVPDPDWGEALRAYVVRRPDAPPLSGSDLEAELITHCRTCLAGFKIPRRIVAVDDLPYSPSGKVLKRELRERAREET